jgi:hypothetical protein
MRTSQTSTFNNNKNKYQILYKKKWLNEEKALEAEDKYLNPMIKTISYHQFKISKFNNSKH